MVRTWNQVTDVVGELVTFQWKIIFESDGSTFESSSTLRFHNLPAIEDSLAATGFVLDEVRDAPDRPDQEIVFLAHRP